MALSRVISPGIGWVQNGIFEELSAKDDTQRASVLPGRPRISVSYCLWSSSAISSRVPKNSQYIQDNSPKIVHKAQVINARSLKCLPGNGKVGNNRSYAVNTSSKTGQEYTMYGDDLPSQTDLITSGGVGTAFAPEYSKIPDADYLQELLAIQQQGPRDIGFFGTRNMGFMHQQLIEILSYAMVITKNHIFTSGSPGTNAAVIRGALRAERPDLLTVILPQSLKRQPPESQELLAKVQNVIEMPHNDHLPLIEASRQCNMDILAHVQQVICFAFHDSNLLMETCQEAKNLRKIVTLFYLD
eukprot:jgi/Mesen1/4864/ME000244S04037